MYNFFFFFSISLLLIEREALRGDELIDQLAGSISFQLCSSWGVAFSWCLLFERWSLGENMERDNCVCCACLQLFMAPFAFKTTDGFFCFLPFDKDIEGRAEWEERREKEDLPSSLCHFQFGIKDLFNRAQELPKSFILLALFFHSPCLFCFCFCLFLIHTRVPHWTIHWETHV